MLRGPAGHTGAGPRTARDTPGPRTAAGHTGPSHRGPTPRPDTPGPRTVRPARPAAAAPFPQRGGERGELLLARRPGPHRQRDPPHRRGFREVRRGQLVVAPGLHPYRRTRQQRHPESAGHELDQRGEPGGRGRHRHTVGAPRLPADVQRLVPQAVPLVEQQQIQLAQGVPRNVRAPGQPVLVRGDQHELLVEQGQFHDPRHTERDREQQQVEPPGGQPLQERGRLLLMHLEVEGRVLAVDEPQHGRQQIRGDGGNHPEPQHPGEGRPYRVGLVHQLADRVEHRRGPHREPFPGGRQQHPAGGPFQELYAEGVLQGRYGTRQGGLAHADRGGRVPEVQMLRHGREGTQLRHGGLLPLVGGSARIYVGH